MVFLDGFLLVALAIMIIGVTLVVTFTSMRAYTWRYLFPGLLGFALFVLFPLFYTVYISFTNYSSTNLLRFERVVQYFEEETYLNADLKFRYNIHPEGSATFRFVFEHPELAQRYVSDPVPLGTHEEPHTLELLDTEQVTLADALPLRELVARRQQISAMVFQLPAYVQFDEVEDGEDPDPILLNYIGLREFGPRLHLWQLNRVDGTPQFTHALSGEVIAPDHSTGFFTVIESEEPDRIGTTLSPGFRVIVGLDNYLAILTDKGLQGPFIRIFIWTVTFAVGSVFLSLCVGMFLAVLLEWKELKGRHVYRTLLILPYAVPAFISILIFRGLFNQNFGEINMILDALFGIQPEWFANPMLAKTMILIVNTWLGYPYMMIVCTGILQSVPDTIYEASALDGSGPITNFFFLTLPLIFRPLFPLLVASFAFNFNNFLIIYLLTGGGPDMVGSSTVAGETDILVSYTFRIAFRDSAQNFGYASAIATLIFIIVALLAWYNLRHTVKDER